jgi:hypothetical protein
MEHLYSNLHLIKKQNLAKTKKKNLTKSVVSTSFLRTKAIIPIIEKTGENKAPVFKWNKFLDSV